MQVTSMIKIRIIAKFIESKKVFENESDVLKRELGQHRN